MIYGLQLCTEVRTDESKNNTVLILVQKAQKHIMQSVVKVKTSGQNQNIEDVECIRNAVSKPDCSTY
jgi:hypothetical protein